MIETLSLWRTRGQEKKLTVDTVQEGAKVKDGDQRDQVKVDLASELANGDGIELCGMVVIGTLSIDFVDLF